MANENVGDIKNIKIAKIRDRCTLVINKGRKHGIREGQRVLVFCYGEEILDPDTKQSLGLLEIVKGTGVISHLQDDMATIESTMKAPSKRVIKKRVNNSPFSAMVMGLDTREESEEIIPADCMPFDSPEIGDMVKLI